MVRILAFICVLFFSLEVFSQDTLPDFKATTRGNNRVIISWANQYPLVKQISIQRSLDSSRNYKTILTVPDPTIPQNGFVDTKAQHPFMFYRLFIVLDSGKYVFSKPRRAVLDTSTVSSPENRATQAVNGNKQVVASDLTKDELKELQDKLEKAKVPIKEEPAKFFMVMRRDTLLTPLAEKQFKAFRDSLVNKTRDTMVFVSVDTILIKPFVPKVIYKPSQYIFTEKDGNVAIVLPRASQLKYSIKFFEDNLEPLFEIKQVKETHLTLDKANFLHAGWFRFELYEDGALKEKHRFYIPKDF